MPELPRPWRGDLAGLQGQQQPPGQAAIGERRLWTKEKLGWSGGQPGELGGSIQICSWLWSCKRCPWDMV